MLVRVEIALFLVSTKNLGLTQKGGPEGRQFPDGVIILLGHCQGGHHLVPYLLLFFERANKIGRLCRLGWRQHKDSELRGYVLVGKRKLVGDVDNIASYTILHNSMNLLRRGPLGSSVVNEVCFIGEEAKGHACRYFKTMEESINPAFYAWVIIECVAVDVAKFRGIPL